MRILMLAALLALTACVQTRTMEEREIATSGNRALFDDAVVAKVVEGTSTKAEVKATFGEPTNVVFAQDGSEQWLYHAMVSKMATMTVGASGVSGGQTQMDSRTVTILFAESGVVRKMGVGRTLTCSRPGGGSAPCPQ